MNGEVVRVTSWPPPRAVTAPVPPTTDDASATCTPPYRDFSSLRTCDVPQIVPSSLRASRRRKGPKELSFPTKLYDLLSDCRSEGLEHIISWQEHGRSFIIADSKLFSARWVQSNWMKERELLVLKIWMSLTLDCVACRSHT